MKKQLPGFLTGVIVSALVFTAVPAIAAQLQTIDATLNSVNIEVNGAKVASAGEDYTLDNGEQTAGSIVYNETTYVPIRRFGEVMGADIGWNQETGSVTVAGDVKVADPSTTPAPDTALSDDYSTWTAEEEAAYQEFKEMWEVEDAGSAIYATYSGVSLTELKSFFQNKTEEQVKEFCRRLYNQLFSQDRSTIVSYLYLDTGLWSDIRFSDDNIIYGYSTSVLDAV